EDIGKRLFRIGQRVAVVPLGCRGRRRSSRGGGGRRLSRGGGGLLLRRRARRLGLLARSRRGGLLRGALWILRGRWRRCIGLLPRGRSVTGLRRRRIIGLPGGHVRARRMGSVSVLLRGRAGLLRTGRRANFGRLLLRIAERLEEIDVGGREGADR